MHGIPQKQEQDKDVKHNTNWQGVDKDPVDEKNKAEKVTRADLKKKKIDADPGKENEKP